MSQSLTISDDLFSRLEATARHHGLPGVVQLLEAWQASEEEQGRRRLAVQRIEALRNQLFAAYGEMPDSAPMIREDRER